MAITTPGFALRAGTRGYAHYTPPGILADARLNGQTEERETDPAYKKAPHPALERFTEQVNRQIRERKVAYRPEIMIIISKPDGPLPPFSGSAVKPLHSLDLLVLLGQAKSNTH